MLESTLLNDLLAPIEIEKDSRVIRTKLVVKWIRIAQVLGILAGFQVIFALSALIYCKGRVELLDDVSTMSAMLEGFSRSPGPGGTDCQGEFVPEGNGFRWVLIKQKDE